MKKQEQYSSTAQMLALSRFGSVGPRTFDALMVRFGSLGAILSAEKAELQLINGLSASWIKRITAAGDHLGDADKILKVLLDRGINVTSRFEADYNHLLFELNNPPNILYFQGMLPVDTMKSVAIVGAENATSEGIGLTALLVKAFCRSKVQIVSTLSGGIDVAAHLASRSAGGMSFAVLDRGIDHADVVGQVSLAHDIAQAGGVISEYSPEMLPTAVMLEAANRLVVGFSQGVVVTELYADSARALDLLDFCASIGKLSFVVTDPRYGVLIDETSLARALKCGAILIDGADHVDDIIRSLV